MKNFKHGQKVEFTVRSGEVVTGEFVRTFSPARNAGQHYEVQVGYERAVLFAQGAVGKTLRAV